MTLDLFSGFHIQQEPLVAIATVIGWLVCAFIASILFIYAAFVVPLMMQMSRSAGQLLERYDEAIRQCLLDIEQHEQDDDMAGKWDQVLEAELRREAAPHLQ